MDLCVCVIALCVGTVTSCLVCRDLLPYLFDKRWSARLYSSSSTHPQWKTGMWRIGLSRGVWNSFLAIYHGATEGWCFRGGGGALWQCSKTPSPPLTISLSPPFTRVWGDLSRSWRGDVGRLSPPAASAAAGLLYTVFFSSSSSASSWICGLKVSLGLSFRSSCFSAARTGQPEKVSKAVRLFLLLFPRWRRNESPNNADLEMVALNGASYILLSSCVEKMQGFCYRIQRYSVVLFSYV